MESETTSTTTNNETLIAQGISFLKSLRGRTGTHRDVLLGRIEALEKSGFKPAEITEVLKRYSEDNFSSSSSHGSSNDFVVHGNRQGWFLNSVLPAILVLGAGAIALYLTGGEDEDTTLPLKNENELMTVGGDDDMDERNGRHRRRRSRNGDFVTEGQHNRSDEEAYHALHEPYNDDDGGYDDVDHDHEAGMLGGERDQYRTKQTEPDWAKELMRITSTIADDVQNIKHKLLQSNSVTTSGSIDIQTTSSSSSSSGAAEQCSSDAVVAVPAVVPKITIVTVREHMLRLRGTLQHMASATLECNSINNGSADGELPKPSLAHFQQGCGALLLYVSKVHEHPSVPRYRKIAVSNATFKTLVEPLSGHAQVLAAVGFSRLVGTDGTGAPSQVQGKNFEWTWGGPPPEVDKDPTSTLLLGVNGSSDTTGKDSDLPQNPSNPPAREGAENTAAAASTTTTTGNPATADVLVTGLPTMSSPSSSSLSSQAAAIDETTRTVHAASTTAVVTSCTPYSRPATDIERAAVLSECLRILQIGKDKGAAAVMTEIQEPPS